MAETGETSVETTADDGGSVWSWLLPALAFLAGAALSAALFVLGGTDDLSPGGSQAAPTASPTEDEDEDLSEEPEVVVQVPAVCVEAAELAQTVTSALGDVADAAGTLDARRLQESLDVVQQIRPEVEATSRECRDLALDGRVVTQDPTPTATATPSPTATPAS